MSSKKILFICLHRPNRTPSQRFRFEQYIDYLNENGFVCQHKFLLNKNDDTVYYSAGNIFRKLIIVLKSFVFLWSESSKEDHDIVFVQREAFMLGTAFFEKRFSKKAKLVFDLDDSIWLQQTGEIKSKNKLFYFLKNPAKTKEIVQHAHLILAGNEYIANFAAQFNNTIEIIPTTIDTDIYKPLVKLEQPEICIGWSGSFSTIIHFQHVLPALLELKEKYQDKIYFKVIGDGTFTDKLLNIQGIPWNAKTELENLSEIDIGLMPLPDDEWTKGKCALKALQYMALGIPCVVSPVGVNTTVISDGVNGYLAENTKEWVDKLSLLIDNYQLRQKLGSEGLQTVQKYYSVKSIQNKFVHTLLEL